MKLLLLSLFLIAIVECHNSFCTQKKCITCNGMVCMTTCVGQMKACKKCTLGDCCDGEKCNACRGKHCCKDLECNQCISACFNEMGVNQHAPCFNKCVKDGNNSSSSIELPLSRYVPTNVTTIVNITNRLKNYNNLDSPVYVDGTHSINGPSCCQVVRPEVCANIQGEEGLSCFTPRNVECSKICNKSKHVHIIETERRDLSCIQAGNPPYFYCGKYAVTRCDECYKCNGESLEDCVKKSTCPFQCKKNVKEDNFYNKLYKLPI